MSCRSQLKEDLIGGRGWSFSSKGSIEYRRQQQCIQTSLNSQNIALFNYTNYYEFMRKNNMKEYSKTLNLGVLQTKPV